MTAVSRSYKKRFVCPVLLLPAILFTAIAMSASESGEPKTLQESSRTNKCNALDVRKNAIGVFSNGATITLLGVSDHAEGLWWKPTGERMEGRIHDDLGMHLSSVKARKRYDFAFKVDGAPSGDMTVRARFGGEATLYGCSIPRKNGKRLRNHIATAAMLPSEATTIDMQLAIARGPWNTFASSQNQSGSTVIADDAKFVFFSKPYEIEGDVVLCVTHNLATNIQDVRVVATSTNGRVSVAAVTSQAGTGEISQADLRFPNMGLDQIAQFEVQTRTYEWVSYNHISLRPKP